MSGEISNYHAGAWSAAAIASEQDKALAMEIIKHLELNTDFCDLDDWNYLSSVYGGSQKLIEEIHK